MKFFHPQKFVRSNGTFKEIFSEGSGWSHTLAPSWLLLEQ